MLGQCATARSKCKTQGIKTPAAQIKPFSGDISPKTAHYVPQVLLKKMRA
jgi:hypothetical protein